MGSQVSAVMLDTVYDDIGAGINLWISPKSLLHTTILVGNARLS